MHPVLTNKIVSQIYFLSMRSIMLVQGIQNACEVIKLILDMEKSETVTTTVMYERNGSKS
jgi:hypothetical protein